jgi:hypothetical protein
MWRHMVVNVAGGWVCRTGYMACLDYVTTCSEPSANQNYLVAISLEVKNNHYFTI